jgi:hypothetical protein
LRAAGLIAARGLLLLLCGLSGIYCLLAYVPFTYQAFVRFTMISWLPAFLRWQPLAFLLLVAANAAADPFNRPRPGRLRLLVYLVLAGVALALLLRPVLTRLENDLASYRFALGFLVLPVLLLVLDLGPARQSLGNGGLPDPSRRLVMAALASGCYVWSLFTALAVLRALAVPASGWAWADLGGALGWSLPVHLLVFLMLATGLLGLQSLARLWPAATRVEADLLLLGTALAVAGVIQGLAFSALGLTGWAGFRPALLLGLALASYLSTSTAWLAWTAEPVGALDVLVRPLLILLDISPWIPAVWLATLAYLTGQVLFRAAAFDWNFLIQKLVALVVWGLAFATFYACFRRKSGPWSGALVLWAATVVLLALFKTELPTLATRHQAGLDRYAGFDPSTRVLWEALRPVAAGSASIYAVLQKNTNISQAIRTDPVDVNLVPDLQPAPGPKPDIFIFVVDSLRRDYLGSYNPAVTFTPAIDRFAAESDRLPNSFSRYGATGLSEPSIWVGGMMLHKQYVTPFHPMNTLQKLLDADGYRSLITMDSILDVVVRREPALTELNQGVLTHNLRMCATVTELEDKLRNRGADPRPIFSYSQVQDLHISVINREGKDVPGGGEYPGFYAPYAARVRRLDPCFGEFIQFLKDQGLYQNSIVILTADHGDSLGEDGRFGHAYTLFPEIIKIPLIIHLPPALRQRLVLDPARPALLTDLSPTLYYLLGHRQLVSDPLLGRPIYTDTAEEQARGGQDHLLLASSYGAVYGILADSGRSFYIADGVALTDYFYDLGRDPRGLHNALTPDLKRKYDAMILKDLEHLNAFYKFQGGH